MKKKYLVDVYATLAQTIEVEAESREEADKIAEKKACSGTDIYWSVSQMTGDLDIQVCGEVDENGERVYY